MRAEKRRVGQARFQVVDLVIRPISVRIGFHLDGSVRKFKKADLIQPQQHKAVAAAGDNLLQRRRGGVGQLADAFVFGGDLRFARFQFAGAFDGLSQPFAVDGFEQVADGVGFKCVERVLIKSRREDDQRRHCIRRQSAQRFKAGQTRHLHVQKNQVGFGLFDLFQGGDAVGGFADDLNLRMRGEQLRQPGAGRRFVVYDQGSELHGLE